MSRYGEIRGRAPNFRNWGLVPEFPLSERHLQSLHSFSEETALHRLHHFLRLDVLLEQLIDLLDAGSAALCNAFASTSIDDLMVPPFLRRHGIDDRFGSDQFLFVYLRLLHVSERTDARQHAQNLLHA